MTEEKKGSVADLQTAAAPKRKKWPIVVGIVAAVLIVCGIGFGVWHNTPGFCNAVCHAPMDNYVESYYEGDPGCLVTQHAAAKVSCLDCHEARIGEQVAEVGMWIDDSFVVDEQGNLQIPANQYMANEEFCLKSGCHDWNDVVDATWGFEGNDAKYNPHSSHQDGSLVCGDCHKSHSKSTLYCGKCHTLNAPEGWEVSND